MLRVGGAKMTIGQKFCAILALTLAAIIVPRFAAAQTMHDLNVCKSAWTGGNSDAAIRACSVFINTRRSVGGRVPLPARALLATLGFRGLAYARKGEYERAI